MIHNLNLRNLTILIADDNSHMRRIIRTLLLSLSGRNVIEAENGEIALDLYRSQQPDLIITDLEMPVLDGIEFARAVRDPNSQFNPYVPIIMVSDIAERGQVIAAREAGVNEFMKKPISANMLNERIYLSLVEPRAFIRTATYFGPCRHRKEKKRHQDNRRGGVDSSHDYIEIEPILQLAS